MEKLWQARILGIMAEDKLQRTYEEESLMFRRLANDMGLHQAGQADGGQAEQFSTATSGGIQQRCYSVWEEVSNKEAQGNSQGSAGISYTW